MPRTRRRGPAQAGELPGTLKRSSKEAQETFTKAHDSAVQAYGEGDEADRATYAEFKRKFEKRGDHWVPRQSGPADLARARAALTTAMNSAGTGPGRLRRGGALAAAQCSSRRRAPPGMRRRGPRLIRRGRISA